MDISTIIARLREDCGFGDVLKYTDVKLTLYINDALKKISEIYPLLVRDKITTVIDQTNYTITKTGLLGIKQVFYDICPTSLGTSPLDVGSTFSNSQSLTNIMNLEIAKKLQPSGAEIKSFNSFDLIPTPTSVFDVYYEYKRVRGISEIPEQFEEDIYALVTHNVSSLQYQKSNTLLNSSTNPFKFDRRGNATETASSSHVETLKAFKDTLSDILKNIKTKAMKL